MSSAENTAKPVRDEDAFDVDALTAWLAERGEGPVTEVQQFRGGASNLTYLVRTDAKDLILRRPPSGKKAAGAHDMGREHGIQAALEPVFPYVATMVGHEPDESVLGSEFYVMEKVPGLILRQDLPEPLAPEEADALCARVLDVLVALHSVDVSSVPELAALGKGEGYVGRQVRGWIRRLDEEHQPADVGQVLIHNDYRLDNLVLDEDLQVRAVLDWELATVGDPLMDLSSMIAYWVEADDDDLFQLFRRQPSNAPGMWTRREWVDRYCRRTGHAPSERDLVFYEVFGLFRLAVIAQQIWYRYVNKQTTNESYALLGQVVSYLEQRCRRLVTEAGSADGGA
jgi:aminoglycoside phosphotransferase (APT) family kinase protein